MRRARSALLPVMAVTLGAALAHAGPASVAGGKQPLVRVFTEPGEVPRLVTKVAGKDVPLPLEHTHIQAKVAGYVARVEVTQTYKNDAKDPIEAIYVFPLPENSAVSDMKMVIGDRVIRAEIKKRDDARRTYEDAKRQGHTTALLEQERPNIFTQSVANIEPGTSIDVVITYLQNLTYDSGEYEFVFPMVVGPRFIPGAPLAGAQTGSGTKVDTTKVPDASRISPPIFGEGQRNGNDVSLEIEVDAGFPIRSWEAPTHDVIEQRAAAGRLHLTLAKHDSVPNRDFVLRYAVAAPQSQAALIAGLGKGPGAFSLLIQPPALDVDTLVGQRELIFVVDISGSMHGVPLEMCKDAMRQALTMLRPVDTFNVITFAGATGRAFDAPRPANDTNVRNALEYVERLMAGGGTMMVNAIDEALSLDVPDGRHRYVFFLTDGYVGNESEILARTQKLVSAIERRGTRAKVFGFGVGSSVNRMLLDGLGKEGKGLTFYSTTREDPTLAVQKFFRVIDHAVLTDLEIDWDGLAVDEVFPRELPDLFASRPTIVHGRLRSATSAQPVLRGRLGGKRVEVPITLELVASAEASQTLGTLWARSKIASLERDLWAGEPAPTVDAITQLGLEHRLVTAYTSFVAVDTSKKVSGKLHTVVQPVETPEGVDADMAGAETEPSQKRMTAGPTGGALRGYGALGTGKGGGMGYGSVVGAPSGVATRSASPAPTVAPSLRPQPKADLAEDETAPRRERGKELAQAKPKATGVQSAPAPAVQPVRILADGGLDRAEVQRVLSAARTQLGACGALQGRVVKLQFFVSADGKLLQPKLLGGANDTETRCLVAVLKSLRFAAPSTATTAKVVVELLL